jgi:hypothetical protein
VSDWSCTDFACRFVIGSAWSLQERDSVLQKYDLYKDKTGLVDVESHF